MSKERMEDLDKEIEEMEKAVTNRSDEPGTADELPKEVEVTTEDATDTSVVEDLIHQDSPDLTTEEEKSEKKQREDWKKRYKTTKTKLDSTIHSLRVEVASLGSRLVTLSEENEELRTSLLDAKNKIADKPIQERFTAEQREVLGDEALQVMQEMTRKSVEEATAPLQASLAKEAEKQRNQIKLRAEEAAQNATSTFKELLSEQVEDLEAIDTDPKFLEWLNEGDSRGVIRMDLFKRAQAGSDVERVAQFFNEFASKKKVRTEQIERQITPAGGGSSTTESTTSKQKWTVASIDKFYDDVIAGKYKGKQKLQAQLEEAIDSAVADAMKTGKALPLR